MLPRLRLLRLLLLLLLAASSSPFWCAPRAALSFVLKAPFSPPGHQASRTTARSKPARDAQQEEGNARSRTPPHLSLTRCSMSARKADGDVNFDFDYDDESYHEDSHHGHPKQEDEDEEEGEPEDFEKVEMARRSLETVFAIQAPSDEGVLHPLGGLVASAAARYRRQLELELLRRLEDSDSPVNELVHLWTYATTAENGQILDEMSHVCSPGMLAERRQLETMIANHPDWVEPRVRLAVLLFYKGLTDESYGVAQVAFEKQPYHFELVPILVLNCLRRNDLAQAVRWARRGLPTLRGTTKSARRRSRWVEAAVEFVLDRIQLEKEAEERRQSSYRSQRPDPSSGTPKNSSKEASSSAASSSTSSSSVWQ